MESGPLTSGVLFRLFFFEASLGCRFSGGASSDDEFVQDTNQPRGRRWLDLHLDKDAFPALEDDRFRELMTLVPWKSGVCHDFAKILATRDSNLVKAVIGLEAVDSVSADVVSTYCIDKLSRGTRTTEGHANTNRAYFTRQLAFLEFLNGVDDLQASLDEIAAEMGKTPRKAQRKLPMINGKLLLVTETTFVAFMKHVRSEREQQVRNEQVSLLSLTWFGTYVCRMRMRTMLTGCLIWKSLLQKLRLEMKFKEEE